MDYLEGLSYIKSSISYDVASFSPWMFYTLIWSGLSFTVLTSSTAPWHCFTSSPVLMNRQSLTTTNVHSLGLLGIAQSQLKYTWSVLINAHLAALLHMCSTWHAESQNSMSDSSCEWSSAGELSSVCSWSTTHGQSSVLDITVNEAGLLSVQDLSVTNSEGTNWTPSPMKGVPVASTPVSPVQDISANWTPSPLKGVLLMSTPVRKKRHTASKPGSIRRSPSIPKGNSMMFERSPNSQFMSEKWELFKVMSINGCQEHCTTTAHDLGEYDILLAHSSFISVSSTEQRRWIYHYFNTHCPNDKEGVKHPGGIQFFLCGKPVCQGLWLAALGISTSRFYDSRRQFLEETGPPAQKKHRSLSAKSLSAISWMRSYFEKVGDKRPDKDGIFLPTCLTEGAIYSRMVEEIGVGDEYDSICFSQFNRIYRQHFPNVTIPKASLFVLAYRQSLLFFIHNIGMQIYEVQLLHIDQE